MSEKNQKPMQLTWTSRAPGAQLSQPAPPFRFITPAAAWDYGPFSESFPVPPGGPVLRLRLRVWTGHLGVSLMRPNGSALLSEETDVCAGETLLHFKLQESYGAASVLLRTYGDAGAASGEVLSVEVIPATEVDAGALVLGPAQASGFQEMPDLQASNIAGAHEPMRPISLGNTCEAKVQIARVLQFRRWPATSQAAFRLMMLPPDRSKAKFGWSLFDWQGAPFNAVLGYLQGDFESAFEREDLVPHEKGVLNTRWGCEHFHDFEHLSGAAGPFTPEIIDQGYPAARARFDQLAAAFRQHLFSPGPYLYVHACEDIPSELRVRQLINALSARSPHHRFHLLVIGFEDEDSDLSALSEQVSKAYRPRPSSEPDRTWEGDYAAWDKALAPFKLLGPDEPPSIA